MEKKRMSKNFFLILMSAIIVNCANSNSHIDKIVINYTSIDLETFTLVPCQKFEKWLPFATDTISNRNDCEKLYETLLSLKPAESYKTPDTRILIYLYDSEQKADTVCVGKFYAKFHGNIFETNDDFFKILEEYTSEKIL
jgi:hypothetical protein